MIFGKKQWQPVLEYTKHLHEISRFEAQGILPYPWENIGPGYCYGPAFGHWDAVHMALDLIEENCEQARYQIDNLLAIQQEDGMLPSIVWMKKEAPSDWAPDQTHPPVWVFAADKIFDVNKDKAWLKKCMDALEKQITWFEKARCAENGGFYYTDIKNHLWESGVDEGIRFQDVPKGEMACVDASSHVYMMYDMACKWYPQLYGERAGHLEKKRDKLGAYIREQLYDEETGYFYDSWAMSEPKYRHICFEGLWGVISGAASEEQARQVTERHLMNKEELFAVHPPATVSLNDAMYEKRMWRGPAWNSMSMWAALGCMRYGKNKEAKKLLEAALDATAAVFEKTGCIWEFYDSMGGAPEKVARKPRSAYNMPCRDYLGHNPLRYMARLWENC